MYRGYEFTTLRQQVIAQLMCEGSNGLFRLQRQSWHCGDGRVVAVLFGLMHRRAEVDIQTPEKFAEIPLDRWTNRNV